MRRMPALAVCASLAACGYYKPYYPVREAGLGELTGWVYLSLYDRLASDGSAQLTALVLLEQSRFPTCMSLRPDVRVALNGVELLVEEPGTSNDVNEHQCVQPRLTADLPRDMLDGSDALLVLGDPSGTRYELEVAHLFEPHDVARADPLAPVTAGADVPVTWRRPDTWNSWEYLATASFFYPGAPERDAWVSAEASPSAAGAVVHAPVPLPAGPAKLNVNLMVDAVARRCDGPVRCDASATINRELPVEVK